MNTNFRQIERIKEYVEEKLSTGELEPQTYKSSKTVEARQGALGERVVTVLSNGLEETVNTVKADPVTGEAGWIVKNPTGEEYIVEDSVFREKYDAIDGEDGKYRAKGKPVTAARLTESIAFTAPWGEEMRIKAGGYLIISNPADIYGIAEDEFRKTYV